MRTPGLPSATGEWKGWRHPSGSASPVAACFLTVPFATPAENARFVGQGTGQRLGGRGSVRPGPAP